MIKLVGFSCFPLLAAMFFAEQAGDPSPSPPPSPTAQHEDRRLLATLETHAASVVGRVERVDQEFLAILEEQTPAPARAAVRLHATVPLRAEAATQEASMPVRRAIPVIRAVPEPSMPLATVASGPSAVTRIEPARALAPNERRRASIVIFGNKVVLISPAAGQ